MTRHGKHQCGHTVGSRAEVMHGKAFKTSGGLTRCKLMMNKHGRIVSKTKHNTAKKEKRLAKAGYKPKKGTFKIFHKKNKKSGGGLSSLSPMPLSATGMTDATEFDPNELDGKTAINISPPTTTSAPAPTETDTTSGGRRHRARHTRRRK